MRLFQVNGLVAALLVSLTLTGCGASYNVEMIDLDKVLDILIATLDELDGGDADSVDATAVAKATTGDGEAATEVAVPETANDEAKDKQFANAFRINLNAAKLMSQPIGISVNDAGEIQGFTDTNNDNVQGSGEGQLFKIEIDAEGQRLIASDTSGNHRDHRYRPRFGFFTGYMIGSMFNRQSGYYSGSRSSLRPKYGSMSMSPKGYHAGAVAKARSAAKAKAAASSARSKTGSRGFSFGK